LRKITIFAVFLATFTITSIANDIQEINALETEQQPLETETEQLRQRQDNIEKMLAEVEKRYGKTAAELHSLQIKIEQKRRNLDTIQDTIQTNEKQLDREKKELAIQIKAAYKMGQQEQLKLIFNQQDPALSNRMLMYYHRINRARLNKISQIEEAVAKLDQLNNQNQAETAELESILKQKQSQQSALNSAKKQRNELLANLATFSVEEQLTYLQESEKTLQNLITQLSSATTIPKNTDNIEVTDERPLSTENNLSDQTIDFIKLKGQLPWPVKGKLLHKFGSRRLETVWDGVLIEAPEGQEIHAIANGKVIFAEWLTSYGYLLIIEHGGGFMSLYAFNQSLYKHKNDTIKAGDVIASVGQSGGRNQPGLYFGIRKQGIPIDPQQWCLK